MSFVLRTHPPLFGTLHGLRLRAIKSSGRWQTNAATAKQTMSWPEYLAIRRAKRRWEMFVTMPTTVIAFGVGASYLASMEIDHSKLIFGVDPVFVLGAATIACGGLGYLLGPTFGGIAWNMTHRKILPMVEARDRDFYNHIVRNRVDPRAQSPSNPVPDYHGEKIGSLHHYRQWLRDQSRFRKKAERSMDPE